MVCPGLPQSSLHDYERGTPYTPGLKQVCWFPQLLTIPPHIPHEYLTNRLPVTYCHERKENMIKCCKLQSFFFVLRYCEILGTPFSHLFAKVFGSVQRQAKDALLQSVFYILNRYFYCSESFYYFTILLTILLFHFFSPCDLFLLFMIDCCEALCSNFIFKGAILKKN